MPIYLLVQSNNGPISESESRCRQQMVMKAENQYLDEALRVIRKMASSGETTIAEAADAVAKAVIDGGRVLLFGSGHSSSLAVEGHFRAGGLAAVTPVISQELLPTEGATASTSRERTPGSGAGILAAYSPIPDDVLIVFSNSGVNHAPVEIAQSAKAVGMTVIAVVSLDHSKDVSARPGIPKLVDVADIVIDNGGPPGDALITVPGSEYRCGPVSTVAGALILNMILAAATERVVASGRQADIYLSANLPGATEHNTSLIERYRSRNPHL